MYILHQKKLAQLYFWFVISGCETALQGKLYECRPRLTESSKKILLIYSVKLPTVAVLLYPGPFRPLVGLCDVMR